MENILNKLVLPMNASHDAGIDNKTKNTKTFCLKVNMFYLNEMSYK